MSHAAARLAQSVARGSHNPKVVSSILAPRTFQQDRVTSRELRTEVHPGRGSPMAQSVARQAVNLQVAGSNPAGGGLLDGVLTSCVASTGPGVGVYPGAPVA